MILEHWSCVQRQMIGRGFVLAQTMMWTVCSNRDEVLRAQVVTFTYMDPAKSEESKIILHKENFFFILCVAIIRPTILSGDENMRDCEFISHLQRRKQQVRIPRGLSAPLTHSGGKWSCWAWLAFLLSAQCFTPLRVHALCLGSP